jgi:LysR family nod box-dependent transcriptional activator
MDDGRTAMHFRRLDLNLLVALDALLTERNITQAGRRLHLTQSAMSGALARLREFFGDELLVQVGRKMVPTALATTLQQPVHDLLLKVRATLETRPEFDPATARRHFRLIMSDYVSTVLMTEVARRAEQLAPHVTFEIISNNMDAPVEMLERADVDLLVMPIEFVSKDHPKDVLFEDRYVCLVSSDHEAVGDALTVDQYLALGHVGVIFGRARAPAVDQWFVERSGLQRRVEVYAMNFGSIPQFVVGTKRVATVHRRLAEIFVRQLPLRMVRAPLDLPPLVEALQWHSAFDQDPGTRWLRALLKDCAGGVAPYDVVERRETPRAKAARRKAAR